VKETFILTRILFKNALNKNTNKEKVNLKAIAGKIFLGLAIAYIACVIGFLSKEFIGVLQEINQTELFITLVLLLTLGIGLFQSILSALNILYFSKDIEFLLPLPISSIKIVFAKLNVMIISEYIMEVLTFAIPFIVYGIVVSVEPLFYIMAVIIFFLLPIIPTLLGVIVTVILMTFTNIFKNKDVVQYLTVFITFALVIAMQILISKTTNVTGFMLANKMLEIDGLSNMISKYVIILRQAVIAVTEYGSINSIRNVLFLFGESITAYIVIGFLISKTYIKSASNVVSGKGKKVHSEVRVQKKNSIRKAYIDKEFKMLFRTPAFFLNTVLPIIILPVFFAIPIISSTNGVTEESLEAFKSAVIESTNSPIGFAIYLAVINFLYAFNYVSATSISRDGENAIFMKYIPIELYKQCRYKAIPSFILNLFPLAFIMLALIIFFDGINMVFLAELLIVALLCNWFTSYGAVLIDLLNPKLHWTSEYSVVKQNLNMLWDAVFDLIVIVGIFAICSFFEIVHIVALLISAILIVTIIAYDNFIKQNSINIFKKIC